jgi:hypothetical protein
MAISASLRPFIKKTTGHVQSCHQAAVSVLSHIKTGDQELRSMDDATSFALTLMAHQGRKEVYNPKTSIPPYLYDIFGFFNKEGKIAHSAIVVDLKETLVTLAESDHDNGKIRLVSLPKVIKRYQALDCHAKMFIGSSINMFLMLDEVHKNADLRKKAQELL